MTITINIPEISKDKCEKISAYIKNNLIYDQK